MRNLPGALGIALLLALLTWLLLHGVDTNASMYAATLKASDDYALAEASLHRDVLQARAGLLRDYDSLSGSVLAMEDAVARLRSNARAEGLDTGSIDQLAAAVVLQEELLERFKTGNALLRNSLAYVGLLSTSPAFLADDMQLASVTGALAAAILHVSRDTSADALRGLQQRIDQFAKQALADGPEKEVARAMLAHARLLHEQLPAVDTILKTLLDITGMPTLEETRRLFSHHRSIVEAREQQYRLLLYLISLLLLVALLVLGLRLRARALALRRRAAFEHVIAENSTRLINCPPAESEARLKQVLAELGRTINADRAYVVLDEKPVRAYTWSRDGSAYPPGWPNHVIDLSQQLGVAEPDHATIPDVTALPRGPAREALASAGVRAWACVSLMRPGRAQSLMGFDHFRPLRNQDQPMPILRLAADAVANALERELLERERARLAIRLERARRMQMVGSLASGIAHNFNNIISAILGYSEMIEPQLAPGTSPAQHVDEIRKAAERGRDLVDNILAFGRRSDAQVRQIPVRGLLEEATSFLRASLRSEVELVLEEVADDVTVSGEPAQLQQVILNLCTNAAQAMEEEGQIRLAVRQEEVTDGLAMSEGDLSPGRYVCLSVSDTGRGFDERTARRMFEPFFTTRLAGTGLGLATVREIVRDHDGAIGVQSNPGHGSRFEIWLPAATADGFTPERAALPLGRGQTVVIVDGDRERLLRDEEKLAALGYEPVGFERPADVLAACSSEPGRFDAILISHGSPIRDGLALAEALHLVAPRSVVLLAAAPTMDVSASRLAEAGISELLQWPLASAELATALARCLRKPGILPS